MDPRKTEPLEAERAIMLTLLTTNLPPGIPRPNRIIDSGRGYWGFWKLETPQSVDGAGKLTSTVESYGEGLEQAFNPYADRCHNIDRIARLPGTRNSKTGNMARVLHDYSHDTPYPIESFPRASETPKVNDKARIQIDWTKVKKPGWLTSAAGLPDDTPRKIKIIVGHKGKDNKGRLRELEEDLQEAGLITKRYGSWSEVTFALAAALKHWNRHSPEEIAEALMANLPCNEHVTNNDDPHRAVERAINRSHDRKPAGEPPSEPTIAVPPPEVRHPLHGGCFDERTTLALLNSHYMVGRQYGTTAIYHVEDDGRVVMVPEKQFKLEIANICVPTVNGKPVPSYKFWVEHPQRHERRLVFKPYGELKPGEYNHWRGFGVEARKGWQKLRHLMRHIYRMICKRDKAKFKYLMRWLAWAVQHPNRQAETVVLLVSRAQGSGKTILGDVMKKIFGRHGGKISNRDDLLGRFNDATEHWTYLLGEEILWAGDHKATDVFKDAITAATRWVETKFGAKKEIPNMLHIILLTNHEHAVAAGVKDRRFFVIEVDDTLAQDKKYFDPIYADLENGAHEEFLYLLQNLQLGDWHPRQLHKTAEAITQQRMSADSVCQWAQACVNADELVNENPGWHLGTNYESKILRKSHAWYCKQHGLRSVNEEVFGEACTAMFGLRRRFPATNANKLRPWGYDVPEGDAWQEKIDERLGIAKADQQPAGAGQN
jgi:hypothetical protein